MRLQKYIFYAKNILVNNSDLKTYNIIQLNHVVSTNNYALTLKSSQLFKEGLVVISDFQKKGRGQISNSWESKKGMNLLLSVVIEPNIDVSEQFDLSKIASLSVMDTLFYLGLAPKIKWPNDILIRKKKISGILIDNIVSGNRITHSIIGVGLNVNQVSFNDYLPKATSLRLEFGKKNILEDIKNLLLNNIANRLKSYRLGLNFDKEYLSDLYKKDRSALFSSSYETFDGIIRGVSKSGLLIVETNGYLKYFDLKEIKMIF